MGIYTEEGNGMNIDIFLDYMNACNKCGLKPTWKRLKKYAEKRKEAKREPACALSA